MQPFTKSRHSQEERLQFAKRAYLNLRRTSILTRRLISLAKERISNLRRARIFSGDINLAKERILTYGAQAFFSGDVSIWQKNVSTYSYELGSSSTESIWPNDVSRIKIIIMIMTYINNSRYLHFFFHFQIKIITYAFTIIMYYTHKGIQNFGFLRNLLKVGW